MKKSVLRGLFSALLIFCVLLGSVTVCAQTADLQVSYKFSTILNGRADGAVTVKFSEYNDEDYKLFWGTESALLPGYQCVADMSDAKIGKSAMEFSIAAPTGIPAGATHLWVTLEGALLACVEIPEERRTVEETPLYSFGVLSDIHMGGSKAKAAFFAAMDDFSARGVNFVLSSGDNTSGGSGDEWREFAQVAGEYPEMPLWLVLGNHDALAWNLSVSPKIAMQNVKSFFPNYANSDHTAGEEFEVTLSKAHSNYDYTIRYKDDLYIMMGIGAASNSSEDRNVDQKLSTYQLEWLEECLQAHYAQENPGKVFLIFHYYTLESGMHVREGTEWDKTSSSKLHRILNKYPGVIYFNGHSHFAFGESVTGYADKYASFHVPSSAYAGNYVDGEWVSRGYQGYVVEVYEGYTLVKGIDFLTEEVVACAYFRLEEDFSDAAKTYGVSLRTTAGGTVQWRANGGSTTWAVLVESWDLKVDGSVQSVSYGTGTLDFRANATHLQWRMTGQGDDAWADLMALSDIPAAPVSDSSTSDSGTDSSSQESSFPWAVIGIAGGFAVCAVGALVAVLLLKKKK